MTKGMLSEVQREAMRLATHGAALALVDDLQHIRRVVGQEQQSPGDLRRMSNQLRRILVEGDLRKIAVPRMGKIEIVGPDLRPFYRANEQSPFPFAAADTFTTHGMDFSAFVIREGPRTKAEENYRPDNAVSLRVEPFQNQKVLCFEGQWITRADLIKYVANVAHGTHSGSPKEGVEFLIRKIRNGLTITMETGPDGKPMPTVAFNKDVLAPQDAPIQLRPHVIDLALLYMISTAQFLTTSPDVIELERIIAASG